MMIDSSVPVCNVTSKTETELNDLYEVLQRQQKQIEVLRSRLVNVLHTKSNESACGNGPDESNLNSPLVNNLKELKLIANRNTDEITLIIGSLEI